MVGFHAWYKYQGKNTKELWDNDQRNPVFHVYRHCWSLFLTLMGCVAQGFCSGRETAACSSAFRFEPSFVPLSLTRHRRQGRPKILRCRKVRRWQCRLWGGWRCPLRPCIWAQSGGRCSAARASWGSRAPGRLRCRQCRSPPTALGPYPLQASSMSPHRSSSRAMNLLRNHTAKLLQKTHDWAFFPIPESSVPWIRVKAECNAKIWIVLSIAEAHPRIAVCRTAKRAFGFLPKAKACLREQDTEFLKPKCNRSYRLQVALIVIVIVIVRRVRNL